MKAQALTEGLSILRSYMKRNDFLQRIGNNYQANVLWEELSEEDSEKLVELGWGSVDDRVGFIEDNPFRRHFNSWFDKQGRDMFGSYEVDLTQETEQLLYDMMFTAMTNGVTIGCYDSELTKASMDYETTIP